MKPTEKARITRALLLVGETKSSIADNVLFRFQPPLTNRGHAFLAEPGEPGYVPGYLPENATTQEAQDLLALQQFAWQRLFGEFANGKRLEDAQPELMDALALAYPPPMFGTEGEK